MRDRGAYAATARWRWLARVIGLVVLVPVAAGLLGVVLPAFGMLPALGAHAFGLDTLAMLFAEPGIGRSIALSAGTGLVATLISLVLAALILAATFGTPALHAAERLLAPILSVPHAAAALGFVVLFAPSGLILRLLSPWATGFDAPPDLIILNDPWGGALVAALVVKEVPFLFMMALSALPQVRARERAMVARSLGYPPMTAFLTVVWPLVYRQIRLPVLAVLAFAASVVDMALILGPNRPPTLSVRIVGWLQSADLEAWLVGSAGALVMLLMVGALIAVWMVGEALAGQAMALARASGVRGGPDGVLRGFVVAVAALGVMVVFFGFLGLVAQSFMGYWPFPQVLPQTLSAAAWQAELPMAAGVLAQTLWVALGSSAIALLLAIALLEADRRGMAIGWLIYAPLLLPQVAFLFGLNVLAIALGLAPGAVVVTLAHALFTLPYTLIALSGPWAAFDPRFEAVAASLGAGALKRFVRVRLALLVGPIAVATALSVAVSVGLYLPTQMLGGGRVVTVTTEAVAAASAGDRRFLGIFATLQLLLPAVAFGLARGLPLLLGVRPAGGIAR